MKRVTVFLFWVFILTGSAAAVQPVNTFSIVGCDPVAGEVGVAVASKYFAVGAVVPWAKAGVGAVATQSWLNYDYGILGLRLLEDGFSPAEVIESLTVNDPGAARRQIGVIDAFGNAATYTGPQCLDWAGGIVGKNCAAQGNILTGDSVVIDMVKAFENSSGELADRLMAALLAGNRAGGDSRGKQSAALYVARKSEGIIFDAKIDIRVDDSPEPFAELSRLYKIAKVNSCLDDASHYYQNGDIVGAVREARNAVELGPGMAESYYDLACYLTLAGELDQALASLETALKLAPRFKNMAASDSDFDGLKSNPDFQQLIR